MLTRLRASEGSLDTNSECSSSQDDNALVECESITTAAGSKAKRKAKAIEARPDQWVCIVPGTPYMRRVEGRVGTMVTIAIRRSSESKKRRTCVYFHQLT